MKKRRTGLLLLMVGVLALFLLTGCKGKLLPEGMDEETLISAGQEVADLLMDGEYQQVYDRFREDIRENLTVDNVKNLMETGTEGAGDFKKVKDTLATGSTEGEDHGIAVIYCEYTKENVRFRVAFDPDMNLIGLEIGQN